MKARDHAKIMRGTIDAMRERHKEELARMQHFFAGEIHDRERIMDNYSTILDRYDVEIAELIKMLRELGVSAEEIDRRLGNAVKAWIYGDEEVQL